MTTISLMALIALFTALIATRLAIAAAPRLGMVDHPDGIRKNHSSSTPMLGGPALYIGIVVPMFLLWHLSGAITTVADLFRHFTGPLVVILAGGTLALILGLLDDRFDLRPRWKLLGQCIIAVIVYKNGMGIHAISNPFGGSVELGLMGFPVTLLWFMGCMNAVNLMDGLDGLAAGICLFVGVTLFLVSLHFHNVMGMLLLAVFSGAILGFLVFNFPPARIFLGDSGSMLLGYLVAAFSLLGASRKAEAAVALFIPIVALGLPIMDTTVAIVRRWYKHLPIATPDRKHIHHRLVAMGYSQQRAVLVLYAASVVLAGFAVLITFGRSEVVVLVVVALIVMTFVTVRIFSGVRLLDVQQKLRNDNDIRRRMARINNIVDEVLAEIEKADTLQDLWTACTTAFEQMELDRARMLFRFPDEQRDETRLWQRGGDTFVKRAGDEQDGWAFHLNLRAGQGRLLGRLEVEKYDLMIPEVTRFVERLRNAIEMRLPYCLEYLSADDAS